MIPVIKIKNYLKRERDYVKINLRGNNKSEKSDMYELKMSFFDNGKSWELLLFVQNLNMMLEEQGNIAANKKLQYLCTILCGETLHQLNKPFIQIWKYDHDKFKLGHFGFRDVLTPCE